MFKVGNTWLVVKRPADIPAAWIMVKEGKTANAAMVEWNARQRKIARVLYPDIDNTKKDALKH